MIIEQKNITSNERWVSNLIGDTYKEWNIHQNRFTKQITTSSILIESETGTGKTSFILNELLPYAEEEGEHILYLCNRTALLLQIKNELENKLNLISYSYKVPTNKQIAKPIYKFKGNKKQSKLTTDDPSIGMISFFRNYGSDDIISICNYQSVSNYLQLYGAPEYSKYIIFDEAHFFTEDSTYNPYTWKTFNFLLDRCFKSICIFMSATLDIFKKIYCDDTNAFLYYKTIGSTQRVSVRENITEYANTYRNQYNKVYAYKNNDELIYKIKNSAKGEKWFIRVHSMDAGRKLAQRIRIEAKRTVRFLSSDSKETKTWEKLTKEQIFTSDVLIATKVIDNGINIKDDSLKHIVLPLCTRVDFLQTLGRRRLSDNSSDVSVYVEQPSVQKISSYIYLLNQGNYNAGKKNSHIYYNPFVISKRQSDSKFYEDLKENSKDPDNYLALVREWLNLPDKYTINHIYSENCSTLEEFLSYYLNKTIIPEDFELFYSSFQYYFAKYCYKLFKERLDIYDESLKIKKGTAHRKATINNSFKYIGLPYKIIKSDNCWTLIQM